MCWYSYPVFVCILCVYISYVESCYNNCNVNGICNKLDLCECFDGWEGSDCSKRSCPIGPQIADFPYGKDLAHSNGVCSGRGQCDHTTGLCKCYDGYGGPNCGKIRCLNDCSNRGDCMSLGQAANYNDGFLFNRTTTYSLWDANVIFGCRCDYGWGGADCSQRICPSGIDPRMSNNNYETVTLVCDCQGSVCSGKFKLQLMGYPTSKWSNPSSRAFEVANAIMGVLWYPGFGNSSVHDVVPVRGFNTTQDDKICIDNAKQTTTFQIKKIASDLPLLSIYGNLIKGGSLYFETRQTLMCSCQHGCNGTFRVSFDGEMSSRINAWASGDDLLDALNSMKTMTASGVTALIAGNGPQLQPICSQGRVSNMTLKFKASFGNVPRLALWSSIISDFRTTTYKVTSNSTEVLRLISDDGRDDSVTICNGLGKCNYETGVCKCAHGWGPDPDLGPCARPIANSSDWAGLGRCPGLVSWAQDSQGNRKSLQSIPSRETLLYISTNPTDSEKGGAPSHGSHANFTVSSVEYYTYDSFFNYIDANIYDYDNRQVLFNLSSNSSAGPLIFDQAKNQLFYVDNNPSAPFIGVASVLDGSHQLWLSVLGKIFGFAADPHFSRRRLFWTIPQKSKIFWSYMDSPLAHSLVSAIGQANIKRPMGIAFHIYEQRIYWTDRSSDLKHSVIRSANYDGSDYNQTYLLKKAGNHSVISTNVTDIVINYKHNNTAFFIDNAYPAAILAVNLNFPKYNDSKNQYDQFFQMYPNHEICSTWQELMLLPEHLLIDDLSDLILWSDTSAARVKSTALVPGLIGSTKTIFTPLHQRGRPATPGFPVGLAFNRWMGPPTFSDFLECYGHGTCLGVEGNWRCQCDKGYFGDCQMRTCPSGPAWFHEPSIDESAHDTMAECSNMGLCNRRTGECSCKPGFEGAACERMSCAGQTGDSYSCGGSGRCVSLRDMGKIGSFSSSLNGTLFAYGSTPHNLAAWDADMIHGCVADQYGYYFDPATNAKGFVATAEGYKLEEFSCPSGYFSYPNAEYLMNSSTKHEVQQINCVAGGGYFKISFRGSTSDAIYFDDSLDVLSGRLKTLQSIGKVDISGSCASVCSNCAVTLTFMSELGSLPLVQIAENGLTGFGSFVKVSRVQVGGPSAYQCSRKGNCNKDTGDCECWKYWGSSDGFGNEGNLGDCGHNLIV